VTIAVIGAGVFGCTIAIELAKAGHEVNLYDRQPEIMYGASRANQGRLHMGYHYPRSPATARACRAGAESFAHRFPQTLVRSPLHYYAIAKEGTLTSPDQYTAFLDEMGLTYWQEWPSFVNQDTLALCVRAIQEDTFIDLAKLRTVLYRDLAVAHVRLCLGSHLVGMIPNPPGSAAHAKDVVIDASFGRWYPKVRRQWEVVEVALFELPLRLQDLSLVVLDGSFASIDPVPGTRRHMLYSVEQSVHTCTVGHAPYLPERLADNVDQGELTFSTAAWRDILRTAVTYVPEVAGGRYRTSMLAMRAVQVGVDATDERPTLVERDDMGIVRVLPGKIDTVMDAAAKVVQLVG
jgi:hypothetical protein